MKLLIAADLVPTSVTERDFEEGDSTGMISAESCPAAANIAMIISLRIILSSGFY